MLQKKKPKGKIQKMVYPYIQKINLCKQVKNTKDESYKSTKDFKIQKTLQQPDDLHE